MSLYNTYNSAAIPPEGFMPGELQYLTPEAFPEYEEEQTIEDYTGDQEGSGDTIAGYNTMPADYWGLEERIVNSFEKYVSENEDEHLAEILPALLPIIAAVAPAVVQGVSSLISNASSNRAPSQQPPPARSRRPPVHRQQPPQRRSSPSSGRSFISGLQRAISTARSTAGPGAGSQQPAVSGAGTMPGGGTSPTTTTGGATAAAGGPLQQLLGLLTSPAILNLLQQAAGSANPGAESLPLLREQTEVTLSSILNGISEWATMASEQLEGESKNEIPEYLLDQEGNFLCDVSSPRERAEVLMHLLQQEATEA